MREARLDTLDELYLHFGSDAEPWTVHLEVRVADRLDSGRLRAAVRAAMELHPLARARLKEWRPTDLRYRWEIPDEVESVPLSTAECDSPDEVAQVRNRLQSTAPPLDGPGPFEAVLAHSDGGDYVMLNLHHGAGDGLSAFRLMTSILRAYAGEPDPVPEVDPLEARDVGELIGARNLGERLVRGTRLARHVGRSVKEPARVAVDGGDDDEPGYASELLRLDAATTKEAITRRPDGATVNDLLLGALAVTVRRWNDAHHIKPERVAIMMPVNVRPPEWQHEILGNFASYVTVQVPRDALASVTEATKAAAEHTAQIKSSRSQGLIVDLLELPNALPAGLKRLLPHRKPVVGERIVDTAVLSNLGRFDSLPDVRELWFSPPGHMPLGTSVGAVTIAGEMFLTVRYRRAQFDSDAAGRFGELFRGTLLTG